MPARRRDETAPEAPPGPYVVPLTVRARAPSGEPARPVLGVSWDEEGEPIAARVGTVETIDRGTAAVLSRIRDRQPWAIATNDSARLWEWLAEHAGTADYRARGTVRYQHGMRLSGGVTTNPLVHAAFASFTWGKEPARIVLDPVAFTDTAEPWRLIGLRRRHIASPAAWALGLAVWGNDVAAWCAEVGLRLRPGRGGIAAQLLTDARWWPEARRKVPKKANALVRPHLPGNHYQLNRSGRAESAVELDLTSAHHQAAAAVRFTDSDDLFIRGAMSDNPRPGVGFYPGTPAFAELVEGHGLLRVEIAAPEELDDAGSPHPAMPPAGTTAERYVWTEELAGLVADGARIVRIIGGVLSMRSRDSLNRYAEWALAERTRARPGRQRWLKPLLLSVYGVMAQSPRPPAQFSFHPTPKGERAVVVIAGRPVEAFVTEAKRAYEPGYVNVADRGLIEAHVRDSVIAMARAMERLRRECEHDEEQQAVAELLAIRADSVIAAFPAGDGIECEELVRAARRHETAGRPVRGLWHMARLHELNLRHATHYTSREKDRMPGVPRRARQRARETIPDPPEG